MLIQRWLLRLALAAAVLASPRVASAYPWMIRHEYTACAQCHVDPSGSGPLTAYGRAMGEVILKTRYGGGNPEDADPGAGAKFLWGAVPMPDWLDLGGNFRVMSLTQRVADTGLSQQIIYMQSDVDATLQSGRWVASGSLGYEPQGGLLAAVTQGADHNIVSRFHWIGYRLDDDQTTLLRVGRMDQPFGIRDILHTLAVRTTTRTNTDDDQQDGVAFAYSGNNLRGELMVILGNYQIRPDDYRERGYAGYLEWAPSTHAAVGISSRVAHVDLDPQYLVPMWRHADGVFGRWATPFQPLVVMSEVDYVIDSPRLLPRNQGIQAMAQADLEVVQGVHYQLLGEIGDFGPHGSAPSYSGWASFLWFCASHVDLRLDAIYESIASPVGHTQADVLLAQAHLYL